MAFDSTKVLKGTGPATSMVAAYCVGVESSAGKVKELVASVEQTITLTGATRSSDAAGNYINTAADSDKADISATLDPTNGSQSFCVVWKSAANPPSADYAGVFLLKNASSLAKFQRNASNNDNYHITLAGSDKGIAVTFPSAGTLHCLVITWDGADVRIYYPSGGGTPAIVADAGTQATGAATVLQIGNNDYKSWRGQYYFWGAWNSVLNSTDAQNIADDPEGTLLTTSGGGGGGAGGAGFVLNNGVLTPRHLIGGVLQ